MKSLVTITAFVLMSQFAASASFAKAADSPRQSADAEYVCNNQAGALAADIQIEGDSDAVIVSTPSQTFWGTYSWNYGHCPSRLCGSLEFLDFSARKSQTPTTRQESGRAVTSITGSINVLFGLTGALIVYQNGGSISENVKCHETAPVQRATLISSEDRPECCNPCGSFENPGFQCPPNIPMCPHSGSCH